MTAEINLSIFTLNCWGIPAISKHRKKRMEAIGEELATGKYDIVCLQEVWSGSDFLFLKKIASSVLPYSYYFYSGVFGSGVCVFSRYIIEEGFFHQWPLNGYVHKIQHGDWFGGKGIGLCRIHCKGISINMYSSHLHAEYNRGNDEYLAHRVLQAFDMSQFIRMTSTGADVVILGGDLNTEPGDLSYKIICYHAGLHDSFNETGKKSEDSQGTSDSARNSYTCKTVAEKKPEGCRIDYIMYKSMPSIEVTCTDYQLPLPERVPGHPFSYSDHEAVQVSLRIKKIKGKDDETSPSEEYVTTITESIDICNKALAKLSQDRRSYWLYSSVLFLTLLCTIGSESTYVFYKTGNILRIIITILLCFTLFMAFVWNRMEVNAVLTVKLGMEHVRANLLRSRQNSF